MIILDPNQTIKYILKRDRNKPEEEQTIFYLRAMTASQYDQIIDLGADPKTKPSEVNYKILRFGLLNWENLKNQSGEMIEAKKEGNFIKKESLDLLPFSVRQELIEQIMELAQLSEEAEKNLLSLHLSGAENSS